VGTQLEMRLRGASICLLTPPTRSLRGGARCGILYLVGAVAANVRWQKSPQLLPLRPTEAKNNWEGT